MLSYIDLMNGQDLNAEQRSLLAGEAMYVYFPEDNNQPQPSAGDADAGNRLGDYEWIQSREAHWAGVEQDWYASLNYAVSQGWEAASFPDQISQSYAQSNLEVVPWDPSESPDIGGAVKLTTTEAKSQHLSDVFFGPGGDYTWAVQLSFTRTVENNVTPTMEAAFNEVMSTADGIYSVNISSLSEITPSHSVGTNHQVGDAVDINFINGIHVDTAGEGFLLAQNIKLAAMNDPNVRYVEGPGGNFARSTPGGQWQKSADLSTMNSHVHFDVFPPTPGH
ncbi:hypothetical protein [Roseateles sp. L2-2]|uniref:hypothetical protein n=1 Tax=Roseateles TaxID=93681 RepID=UPI003D369ABD